MRVMLLAPESGGSCGVLDYSVRLGQALAAADVDVGRAQGLRHGRLSLPALVAEVRAFRPQVLHVQYPMARYGAALLPLAAAQLPGVRRVVTLHEFSQVHPLRRVAAAAFSRVDALILTTGQEREAYRRWYPWSRRSLVIPIGSNIPWQSGGDSRDPDAVCYFGQIRPRRGLEDFLQLARLAAQRAPELRVRVLGAVPAGHQGYCQRLRASCADLPRLVWDLERSQTEVANALAATDFAYLPYPDGASERRSSLLAALGNGALVVTRCGAQTTAELAAAVSFAEDAGAGLARLLALREDAAARQRQRQAAYDWARLRGWDAIAMQHRRLYQRILGAGAPDSARE
ncbi:MAG: hypothetical protein AMXMBFR26_01030 [Porticoccaceae bacterium]